MWNRANGSDTKYCYYAGVGFFLFFFLKIVSRNHKDEQQLFFPARGRRVSAFNRNLVLRSGPRTCAGLSIGGILTGNL